VRSLRRALAAVAASSAVVLTGLVVIPSAAHADGADIQITEIAYGGKASIAGDDGDGEYVELTDVGDAPQDFTGWTYAANQSTTTPAAGVVDLSGFGMVQPGESVIITDLTPADFRTEWGLKSSVKVIQDGSETIGSGPDTVAVFDETGALVDSLGYAAKGTTPGGFSGKGVSAEVEAGQLGAADISSGWTNPATVGDTDGAWTSASGAVGSPGTSALGTRTPADVRETSAIGGETTGADIQITELAYGGDASYDGDSGDGEYVELTNVGYAAQDLSGWYEDVVDKDGDDEGDLDLSGLGTVQPGESVIVTDLTPADFRTEWNLKPTVEVISDKQGVTTAVTLDGGPDTVSIYDGSDTLVDQVSYAAKGSAGGFTDKGYSAFVDYGQLSSTSTTSGWTVNTTIPDSEGSWTSANGAVGSPGASTQGDVTPAMAQNAGVTVSGAADQTATVDTAFSYTGLSASGGTGSYTWTATGLDGTGLSIDSSTGAITGTPTTAATIDVTVTATDGDAAADTATFTITVVAVDSNWSDIVINEVTSDNSDNTELTDGLPPALLTALAASPNDASDLIELYNKGDEAVDITGWKQTDSHAADTAMDFSDRVFDASGNRITSIPAHGYGVFQSGQGLSSGGDSVKIYLPDGTTLVDSVSFGAGQAGYDESLDPDDEGAAATEVYHALARCPADGAGDVNTTSDDAGTAWYSVKVASFGSSNDDSCDTGTDSTAAVQYYNEQPPTGLPGSCSPTAPSGSDAISVPDAVAWPTDDGVSTVDDQCEFVTSQDPTGNDMSSLVFSADGSVLWGAQNKSHLWKLEKDPSTGTYLPATDNGWSDGKAITFGGTDPDASQPDDEGLTVGGNGDLFVTSERDNQDNDVSKDEVLEYDPNAVGTTLAPVQQWNLTADFVPSVIAADGDDANLGFEGVTYVPDSFLTAHGFHDQHLDKTYDPADYPDHGDGLFFLGMEKNGHVYAYALEADGHYQRVADIDTGIDGTSAIADLQFNADDQGIWTACDNDCGVVDSLLRINAAGDFTRVVSYHRPLGLPDDNLEGFAIAPASTAVDGEREVVWSDDGIYGEGNAWNADKTANVPSADWGHALYASTIPVDVADGNGGGTAPGGGGTTTPPTGGGTPPGDGGTTPPGNGNGNGNGNGGHRTPPAVKGTPGIGGSLQPGRTVHATLPTFKNIPAKHTRTVTWYVGGKKVGTGARLKLKAAWAGKKVTVKVAVSWTTENAAGKKVKHSLSKKSKPKRIG